MKSLRNCNLWLLAFVTALAIAIMVGVFPPGAPLLALAFVSYTAWRTCESNREDAVAHGANMKRLDALISTVKDERKRVEREKSAQP